MYFWNSYPFIRLSIALIIGIILFDYLPTLWTDPLFTFPILIAILVFCVFASSKYGFHKIRHLNGLSGLAIIIFIGGFMVKLRYHDHSPNHYRFLETPSKAYAGTIVKPASEGDQYYRYELALDYVISDTLRETEGIIYLYVRKDSINSVFQYGDFLRIKGRIYSVSPPKNPHEFDYKQYLERQHIHSHSFVKKEAIQIADRHSPSGVLAFAYTLRTSAANIIDRTIVSKKENAIAKALILGVKDHLDNEIKKAYASAGAMHVLAVSGLHVGIIYLLLQFLFGRLKHGGMFGKRLFAVFSIVIIWLYALITGLSPSVLRAATMFSMMTVGQVGAREGNIYNTLGIAAFMLLIYDPYLIYSVGFQLSFAAVFGIVYLQPKLYRLIAFRLMIPDKAWAITCVSIAAQAATFPLSAYYFHQFPTYFLLSNLVVIPVAFLALFMGIIMLLLYPVTSFISQILGNILENIFGFLNLIMNGVESLPGSLIEWIYIDQYGLILIYSFSLTLAVSLHHKSFKMLLISSGLILIFLFNDSKQYYDQSKKKYLIFYSIKEKTAIDEVKGLSVQLFTEGDGTTDPGVYSFQINPNRLASLLPPIEGTNNSLKKKFQDFGAFQFGTLLSQKILIIDSTTFHLDFKKPINADIVLIENNAVGNLEWFKEHFAAEHVLLGSSNSYYYVNKMNKQAKSMDFDIHSIRNDGAFVLKISDDLNID